MANTVKCNMWAAMVMLTAVWILLPTGIISCTYDDGLGAGVYSITIALVLLPLVWPLKQLGGILIILQGNFWVSAAIIASLSIYTFFSVPTSLGGMAMLISALMYGIAAYRKEGAETCDSLSAPPRQGRE